MRKWIVRPLALAVPVLAIAFSVHTLVTPVEAAARRCPRGVQACSAEQVGQPCNPNNPNVICSKQSNGAYCCLAYAP